MQLESLSNGSMIQRDQSLFYRDAGLSLYRTFIKTMEQEIGILFFLSFLPFFFFTLILLV